MRLNLGCWKRKIEGFKNLDINAELKPDYVGDAGDLSQFGDEAIEEIYASHILEHFSFTRTLEVLKEWFRVLQPGGTLYIAVPDFDAIVKLYNKIKYLNAWIVRILYGDQDSDYAYHKVSFNYKTLSDLLTETGFTTIEKVAFFPVIKTDNDCSHLVLKGEGFEVPVSLNLIAIKGE